MNDKVYGFLSIVCLVAVVVAIVFAGHAYGNHNDSRVAIAIAVIVIIVVGWIIMTVKAAKYADKKQQENLDAIPITTEKATVISKISEQHVEAVVTTSTRYAYYIVFEFEGRRREKFTVDKRQHALVNEGDVGVLRYKQMPPGKGFEVDVLFIDFKLSE